MFIEISFATTSCALNGFEMTLTLGAFPSSSTQSSLPIFRVIPQSVFIGYSTITFENNLPLVVVTANQYFYCFLNFIIQIWLPIC